MPPLRQGSRPCPYAESSILNPGQAIWGPRYPYAETYDFFWYSGSLPSSSLEAPASTIFRPSSLILRLS
jgi:hypothetical protein